MWEVASVSINDAEKVTAYLRDNYEPFAVTADYRGERIWLRKELKDDKVPSTVSKRHEPRTSRKPAAKPEEKVSS